MIEAAAPAGTITQAFSWLPSRKRGRRGSSEPPPTYAPTQPPGRGDGDRKRSRQVIDRLRLVLHRPGRQSSKGDRAAVCRCANGRERGRAAGSGRIGRGPDHRLFRVSARPGGVQRDRDQPHQPPAGRPHHAPGGTHRRSSGPCSSAPSASWQPEPSRCAPPTPAANPPVVAKYHQPAKLRSPFSNRNCRTVSASSNRVPLHATSGSRCQAPPATWNSSTNRSSAASATAAAAPVNTATRPPIQRSGI